ncbi:ABC transporter permease [bacterium]|jgi:putative ABC transport system permease protein|nr:ABC transporter permease [bacterium]
MQVNRLLFQNIRYYWRTNLAVILGVIAATAVIGGALVVGDSVRDSLRQMSLDRLGDVDYSLTGGRFFREKMLDGLQSSESDVAPAILVQGTVIGESKSDDEVGSADVQLLRAGQIHVVGTNHRLWEMLDTGEILPPAEGEIVINQRVADQVQAEVGDELSVIVEIPASIPRDSLLGDREETVSELVLKVSAIAEGETGLARFGLNPSQQIPLNVFVNLSELQTQIGLEEIVPTPRNPKSQPARVNSFFFREPPEMKQANNPVEVADLITGIVAANVTLEDLALRIVQNQKHGYLSLESEQMILEKSIAAAGLKAANQEGAAVSPVLVYLLNEIWNSNDPEKYSMYSIIAGIDPELPAQFGPFEFVDEHTRLSGNGVYINDWLATDLDVAKGDSIRVKYHVVGDRGELPEDELSFNVAGVVKLIGAADDTGFTPNVPGVTDAKTYGEWRQPFPLKEDRITDRDDLYWDNIDTEREDDYRTTPKIFTSLETAQEIWQSRYGDLTSIRLAPKEGQSLDDLEKTFTAAFLAEIDLRKSGLIVQPIKAMGLQAAQGTTDFTGLFIGFSFFLILAATILVGLLFRLGIETRLNELGLLIALGFQPKEVRKLFLLEGAMLVGIGGLLGSAMAVGYAAIMIYGLKTWWYGAIGTKFLYLSIHPVSLLSGFAIAAVVAFIAIFWSMWQTRNQSTRSLLNGESANTALATTVQNRVSRLVAICFLGGAVLLSLLTLVGIIPDTEAFSGFSWKIVMFFLVGMGLLTGGLAALSAILGSNDTVKIEGGKSGGNTKLGLRNAARNRQRSVMTTSLISSATFVIVAVAAGQQNPTGEDPQPQSGNGGFTLVAETNVPVLNDLNTAEGRSKTGFNLLDEKLIETLDQAKAMPFRMKPGENASCLNLYQTQVPTVLGVPEDVLQNFIKENRFLFANTPGEQPWTLLTEDLESGNIPVLGDMNTLMYSLHKGIGETVAVPNEENPLHTLEVSGMFANSVFQGVLVMSEENFKKVFPEQVGFQYFLIETPLNDASAVSLALETNLADYGFDAERVSDRLLNFLAVQNTYLSTFQTLGGLGLLLGTIGLATVMLRNVIERRSELALLRAVGFRRMQVGMLVVYENAFLLVFGLTLGAISALLAMGPHLISSAANVPWLSLVQLLIAVFAVGMLSVVVAVRAAVKTPILSTLRGE